MNINIKKLHPNAVIPKYAKPGDAGVDVTAISAEYTEDFIEYDTGLAFELPENHVMLVFPRSSNTKMDLVLGNCVGVLDSSYRGSLKLRYKNLPRTKYAYPDDFNSQEHGHEVSKFYNVGDRIGQIIILPYPSISFNEVDELSETERGDGGFGSSGK